MKSIHDEVFRVGIALDGKWRDGSTEKPAILSRTRIRTVADRIGQ